jgi:hypothetical protein
MKQALLALVATLALGVALGLALGRTAPPPDSRCEEVLSALEGQQALLETLPARLAAQAGSRQVQCAMASPSGAGVDATALRAELAQLREELAQTRGEPPKAPEPPPEPPPKALAAQQQGQQLIEEATRAGRWRTEDAQALRRLLIDMDDAQRQDVIQRLVVQINAGKLQSQAQGPLF